MSFRRSGFCIWLTVIIGAISIFGCTRGEHATTTTSTVAPPHAPLRVGIATWPGFAPGFIASEKHMFQDLTVEFSILDDFTARQNAFASGKTDLTIYTLDSLAFDAGHGVTGKAFMMLDQSNGADAIVAKASIHDAKDMKGRKVAYTRGSPSQYFLIEYLKKHGMSTADIQRVEVDDPGRAGEAFISGSVDVAVTWEPNITQIVSAGKGHVVESTRTTPGLIVDVMVVRNDVLGKRRDDLQRFVAGWLRAVDYVKSSPTDAYSIMARNLKIPEKEFPQMASGLLYADMVQNRKIFLPADRSKALEIVGEANQVWLQEKLISKAVDPKDLVTSELIERHR